MGDILQNNLEFTLSVYRKFVEKLQLNNYQVLTAEEYFNDHIHYDKSSTKPFVIIRHDVDRRPQNAIKMAKLEYGLGIKSTYYFRTIPGVFKPDLIKLIADLGHEIGYHYENMDTCNGNIDQAWDDFRSNLEKLRRLYLVKTICMHGSPLSKYDNRDLWEKYDYRTEGIIGEPYLDVDWNEVFYLTDTGRRWDGGDVSIRDNVECKMKNEKCLWSTYHSTKDIITAIENGTFPQKAMITTHPQRWTNNPILWTKELVCQNLKNIVKKSIILKTRR